MDKYEKGGPKGPPFSFAFLHVILPRMEALLHWRYLRHTLALLFGIAIFAALQNTALPFRLALAWDAGVGLLTALFARMMYCSDENVMRRRARRRDATTSLIFSMLIAAAFVSLYAILHILDVVKEQHGLPRAGGLALSVITIALSWAFVHMLFAVHYAHCFYLSDSGLKFPAGQTDETPDYWDFMYYAFVVGMTFQVSDVQVTSRPMRRLTLAHGIVSFFFNTFILALAVNIAASVF